MSKQSSGCILSSTSKFFIAHSHQSLCVSVACLHFAVTYFATFCNLQMSDGQQREPESPTERMQSPAAKHLGSEEAETSVAASDTAATPLLDSENIPVARPEAVGSGGTSTRISPKKTDTAARASVQTVKFLLFISQNIAAKLPRTLSSHRMRWFAQTSLFFSLMPFRRLVHNGNLDFDSLVVTSSAVQFSDAVSCTRYCCMV